MARVLVKDVATELSTDIGIVTIPGEVKTYAGVTAPTGFLLCQGQAVSRTTYAVLYAVLGNSHGSGDGLTTFNLPDYRGVFLRGLDSGRGLDTGRIIGTYQADAFASHNHIDGFAGINTNGAYGVSSAPSGNINSQNGVSTANHAITSSTGGTETRPKNSSVNFIIKY